LKRKETRGHRKGGSKSRKMKGFVRLYVAGMGSGITLFDRERVGEGNGKQGGENIKAEKKTRRETSRGVGGSREIPTIYLLLPGVKSKEENL